MSLSIQDYKTILSSSSNGMSDHLSELLSRGFVKAEKDLYSVINNRMLFKVFEDIGFDDLKTIKLANGWIWSLELDTGKIPSIISATWLFDGRGVKITIRIRDYHHGRNVEDVENYPMSYLIDKNWGLADISEAVRLQVRQLTKKVWGL